MGAEFALYGAKQQIKGLNDRIKELEEGKCRYNCRTKKEAFIAGYKEASLVWCFEAEEEAEKAYKEWLDEKDN